MTATELDPEGLEKRPLVSVDPAARKAALDAAWAALGNGDSMTITVFDAALRAYEAHRSAGGASGWRPIETAPKDTDVILWADGCVGEAALRKQGGGWFWEWANGKRPFYKTVAWQPLPPPPAAPQAETAGKVGA